VLSRHVSALDIYASGNTVDVSWVSSWRTTFSPIGVWLRTDKTKSIYSCKFSRPSCCYFADNLELHRQKKISAENPRSG
jgi:hypothetical protein